jgi:hypothetical protein
MIKAIFINAQAREITEVMIPKDEMLRATYDLIGNDCSLVQTGAYFTGNDTLMIDEEGYFKEGLEGFFIEGSGFFYGNAVIWGADEEGDGADCETSVDTFKSSVIWIDKDKSAMVREDVLSKPTIISYF